MKIHLVSVESPLDPKQHGATADCGVEIKNVQVCCVWDEQEMMQGMPYSRNICWDCYLADKGKRGRMLIYGITERRQDEQSTDTTAGEE